jgi:hypothetical protein
VDRLKTLYLTNGFGGSMFEPTGAGMFGMPPTLFGHPGGGLQAAAPARQARQPARAEALPVLGRALDLGLRELAEAGEERLSRDT